jgi:AbrB family looped-hinge helix DNA binding protein
MQTIVHIDKSGRIVIPKEMRDELGIGQEDSFLVESTGDSIIFRRMDAPGIKKKGELFVWSAQGQAASFDSEELINQVREERTQDILKSWRATPDQK